MFDRLVAVDRCDVVVASVPSASMERIRPLAAAGRTLLFSAALSEHHAPTRNIFQFGETPLDQLARSVPALMAETDARRWFILGSDYMWPRTVGMVAHDVIQANRGTVAGE